MTRALAAQDPVACSPRSAGSSTPRSPASSSAGPRSAVPVILDGVIAGAAALVAQAMAPAAVDACIAGHRSAEPGHAHALRPSACAR